jgi:PIN domain nuclease of toxin-antitoxin system
VILLDTHVWLWHNVVPDRISRAGRATIERASEVGVSVMSCWELALLESAGRVELDRGVRAWVSRALADERTSAIPVTSDIALRAGGLHGLRDPADSVIYATAVELDLQLVTKDARITEHDPARVVW